MGINLTESMEEPKEMMPDGDATLLSLKNKIANGAKVFVDGNEVFKMPFNNLVTFVGGGRMQLPRDGNQLDSVKDLILVDGEPLEMLYKEKPKPKVDTRTPEEIEKSKQEWMDRFGPGGGYETGYGRYTGD